jgi:hydrogenase maturation factor
MKYYTIAFPGDCGQHIEETWSEDQIIKSYYTYWSQKMIENVKQADISKENCIADWVVVHWGQETDQFGNVEVKDRSVALKQIIDLLQPIAALAEGTPFECSEVVQRCVDAVEIALEQQQARK